VLGIVFGCIAPHGDEIVSELVGELDEESKILADAMETLAYRLLLKEPDVIVIATPHNLRIYEHIGIIATSYASGTWIGENGAISVEAICDRDFAYCLYNRSKNVGIPVVLANFGTSEGKYSNMPLDWGTIIPLWFVAKKYSEQGAELPKIVMVTPSREIPWDSLVRFGEIIYEVSKETNRKVAFIASADQGHAHDPEGPYGYDEASKEYDKYVLEIVRNNRLDRLLELDPHFVERAKPDSLWQMLILYGAIRKTDLRNTLAVYGCPTYYGMLVAVFE